MKKVKPFLITTSYRPPNDPIDTLYKFILGMLTPSIHLVKNLHHTGCIKKVDMRNAKDLGVTLNLYLNYNDHVASVVSSCMRALVQINRVRHLFKQETLIKNCLVFSKLCYCMFFGLGINI